MKIKNELDNKQALYFLWATILNQSQSANATLDKTLELFKRLELEKVLPETLSKITFEKILDSVSKKPSIHRFPRNMSKNLYLSIQDIIQKYEKKPSLIFKNFEDFLKLKQRLMEFRGIGQHKAEVAVDIFENFLKKDKFIIKKATNCESLLLTFDKEIQILNSLKEQ